MNKFFKGIKSIFKWIFKNFKSIIAAIIGFISLFIFISVKNKLDKKQEKKKKKVIDNLEETENNLTKKIKQKKEGVKKDEEIVNGYSNDLNDLASGKLPRNKKTS